MKKQDGFIGQVSYVIPEKIQELVLQNYLISDLYLTDIGYYPKARHHFRERKQGIPQFILIYNISGKGFIKIGENTHSLSPDHFLVIPQNVPHSYYADPNDPWTIYWIHFSGKKAIQFSQVSLRPIGIERGKSSRINERLQLFDDIFRNLERGFSVETLEYINICLNYLLASFTHVSQYRTLIQASRKDPVGQSINFMLENLNRKLRLEDLSNELNMSSSHFSRLFMKQTGHAPINYFIQLKMQAACRLLDTTDWKVSEISRELGFEDPFYFSRLFRKSINRSPRAHRAR